MIIEIGTLVVSMTVNFLVSSIKVLSGIMCNSKSMVADGIHSLSDFITDIVALIGTKYSKKRADKEHPEGYGRVEYIVDTFIALVIFLLGIYTIINSFSDEAIISNPIWIAVLLFTIICKMWSSKLLMDKGHELNNSILITSGRESHDDVTSSIGVIIVIILSSFSRYLPILKYIDMIGSIVIGALIIKTAVLLFIEDMNLLIGKNEQNKEIESKIKDIIKDYHELKYKRIELVRHGSYYTLELDVIVLKNIKVYKLINIEKEIIKKIKKTSYKIKFVDINISQADEA